MDPETLSKLAKALRQFKELRDPHNDVPQNAATLWREIVRGVERVADALERD